MHFNIKGSIFKKLTLIIFPIVFIILFISYQNVSYQKFLHTFEEYFNGLEYSKANNLIISEGKYNLLKNINIDKDLKSFFDGKIKDIPTSLNGNKLSKTDALSILNEISRYNLNSDDVSSAMTVVNGNASVSSDYSNAIKQYESKNYRDAITLFSKVPSTSPDYANSLKYVEKSKTEFKSFLLSNADTLAKDDFYTKAISSLKDNYDIFPNDTDLLAKEKELLSLKDKYLAQSNNTKQTSNSNIINTISTSNINTLNLSSSTSYLVFVSLADQKTYIYKGTANQWTLLKTFLCSTGVPGQDTPTGVYNITTRGDWFYSPQFKQGGKYWVSFYGDDYLFHSLPFNEDKKTVADWTLGKKASHGCIRLPVDDSKWIYDNIPSDTKVIIK